MTRYSLEVSSFLFPPTLKTKLLDAGFRCTQDFDLDLKPTELSKEIGCTIDDARHVLSEVRGQNVSKETGVYSGIRSSMRSMLYVIISGVCLTCEATGRSALELLQDEQQQQPIVSFCQQIDEMFGRGIPLGKITEFCKRYDAKSLLSMSCLSPNLQAEHIGLRFSFASLSILH